MAAPVCGLWLRPLVLAWKRELPCVWRALHTSAACAKNRAARVRVGKGDKPVTYEEAHAPHHIAHRKGWLSLHTVHLSCSRPLQLESEDSLLCHGTSVLCRGCDPRAASQDCCHTSHCPDRNPHQDGCIHSDQRPDFTFPHLARKVR
ncbi:small ribosomal subunit protein uS3m isoform X2 [Kogia breviceps]|uniref:small ribosomal subunit protein uS3m isoform X2 n=1 Tax=Kogia breviceps TaxID=27615 RepID=UPI0034D26EE0